MIETLTSRVQRCHCELCGHSWDSKTVPERCPKCHKRRWRGDVTMGRPRKKKKVTKGRRPKLDKIELRLPKPTRKEL